MGRSHGFGNVSLKLKSRIIAMEDIELKHNCVAMNYNISRNTVKKVLFDTVNNAVPVQQLILLKNGRESKILPENN